MARAGVVVEGLLRPDGSLEISQKVDLPPGRVRVTVEAAPQLGEGPSDIMSMLERIWADRNARGAEPRTPAQIDAGISALRDESEEEVREVEELWERARGEPTGNRSADLPGLQHRHLPC